MLENNLKELQVEFRRQKQIENEATRSRTNTNSDNPCREDRDQRRPPPATSSQRQPFNNPVFDEKKLKVGDGDASNPFGDDSDTDDYDSSGKNPFAE